MCSFPMAGTSSRFSRAARDLMRKGAIGRIRHVTAQMATPVGDLMTGSDLAGTEHEMFRPDPRDLGQSEDRRLWLGAARAHAGRPVLRDRPRSARTCSPSSAAPTSARISTTPRCCASTMARPAQFRARRPRRQARRSRSTSACSATKACCCSMSNANASAFAAWTATISTSPITAGEGAYTCIEPVNRFVDLCLGKPVENCADASIGLRSVEVVEAMLRSAKSGRVEPAGRPR